MQYLPDSTYWANFDLYARRNDTYATPWLRTPVWMWKGWVNHMPPARPDVCLTQQESAFLSLTDC